MELVGRKFFVVLTSDESSSPCATVLWNVKSCTVLQIQDFMPAAAHNLLSLVSLDVCPRLCHSVLLYMTEIISKNVIMSISNILSLT